MSIITNIFISYINKIINKDDIVNSLVINKCILQFYFKFYLLHYLYFKVEILFYTKKSYW